MSILTKVLIGLVIVATFPVMYLAASVLNVQNEWHRKVRDLEAAIDKHDRQSELLLHGDFAAQTQALIPGKPITGQPGLLQWQTARDNIMRGASRVWYGRPQAASISAETGTLKLELFSDEVNLDVNGRAPLNEHGLVDKAFLYVFQMSHSGDLQPATDKYVGEFVVSGLPPGTNENIIPIKPALPLSTAEWEALKTSAPTAQWVIYDKMPVDSRDVFVGLTDEEISALFKQLAEQLKKDFEARHPEALKDPKYDPDQFAKRMQALAEEYIGDGQPPTKALTDNPASAEFVVTDATSKRTRFLRPLRDYLPIFHAAVKRLGEINDRIQVLTKEKAYADQALTNMQKKTLPALETRRMRLESEQALVDAELKALEDYSAKLTTEIAQAQQEVLRLFTENKRLLQEAGAGGKLTVEPAAGAPLAAAAQ